MIAELLTRRVTLELGGARWRVLFTHRTLLKIEAETGLNVLAGELDLGRSTARALRSTLAVVAPGAVITSPADVHRAQVALLDGWRASMSDPEPESAQPSGSMPTWIEAWARARRLGLSDQQWLDATPRMVHALSTERLEQVRQREYMQSRAIAVAANFSFCAPKKPFNDDDFMLHPWPKAPKRAMTGEDLMRMMDRFRQQPIQYGKPQ